MPATDADGNQFEAHSLTAADSSLVRLVQLTDCHILENADDCLKEMNTRASFEAVSAAVLSDNAGIDLLLATGDLSQDESVASYRYLAEQFNRMELPVFWLPGNHDNASLMREHLTGDQISAAKQVLVGNWVIIMLDSTIAGESGGYLADAQIEFLQTCLQQQQHRHALVCVHHQPLPSGSRWIDQLAMRNPQRLIDAVKSQPNARAVLWGHVHQEAHRLVDGIEWLSSPSTCVQFKPGSDDFALDDLTPGYRCLELHADGHIVTEVKRLQQAEFS